MDGRCRLILSVQCTGGRICRSARLRGGKISAYFDIRRCEWQNDDHLLTSQSGTAINREKWLSNGFGGVGVAC